MNFSCLLSRECLSPRRLWSAMALVLGSGALQTALASQPTQQVVCTQAPPSTWMNEAQAREAFQADQYLLVKFKVSKGHCHEFYAVAHDGSVVEAYRHPVTGQTVRLTRLNATQVSSSQP
ncbi:PepSY domain-containing protein [Hydrogenophaga soli]|nr:PepSY domain-containing protein [Burkholderiaceae bacterium]